MMGGEGRGGRSGMVVVVVVMDEWLKRSVGGPLLVLSAYFSSFSFRFVSFFLAKGDRLKHGVFLLDGMGWDGIPFRSL